MQKHIRILAVSLATILLSACLEEEKTEKGFINPEPDETNAAPSIAGVPSASVQIGSVYSFTPSASDADGDPLIYSVQNRPVWASFNSSTGQLFGQPTLGNAGTYSGIVIAVSDGLESASLAPFAIRVEEAPPPPNIAPTISGVPATSVTVGNSYTFTPTATDADGDALTFSIQNRPGWANFDTSSGTVSGTPGAGDVGTDTNIMISVSDGTATASLAPFAITVDAAPPPPNNAPTISGSPTTAVVEGNAYAFTPTAFDADGDALTFSIQNRPGWASFNTGSGTLSGIPGAGDVGAHGNIRISVSDGAAAASLTPFSITVDAAPPPPNNAPTISGNPATNVVEGNTYAFTPAASDADGDALTFAIQNRPGWASFNTGSGTLSGTPGPGDVGIHGDIRISVSDGTDTASLAPFAITVDAAPGPPPPPNNPPTISGTPATSVTEGSTYSFTPAASDADGDALTFTIQNRPGWASFNTGSGTLSGQPSAGDVGTYSNIVISVSDGQDSAALQPFAITVENAPTFSVTLNWTPPTENDDGTPLTDLAGYRIYWGQTPGSYTDSVTLNNPGLTSYVVEDLLPGSYEFVATSFNAAGQESVYSNATVKTVP